jgi:hypothetical protein
MAPTAPQGQSTAAKGGRPKKSPFAISHPNCKICKLPQQYRRQLEMMIAAGITQAETTRHWNDVLEDDFGANYLNEVNMSNHVRRHLSAREDAIRRIIEQRVKEHGIEVDDNERILLTKEVALDTVIVTGVQNIARGLTFVEPRELVGAIALKKQFEEQTGSIATDELWRQFLAFQDAVKMIVTPDQRELIATQFEKNIKATAPKELAASTAVTRIEAIEVTEEVPEPQPKEKD